VIALWIKNEEVKQQTSPISLVVGIDNFVIILLLESSTNKKITSPGF
jgi:hypothetical protein